MKVKIEVNGKPQLVLLYEKQEWELLKNKLESLGLKSASTTQGLGENLSLDYYRDTQNLFSTAMNGSRVFDNINEELIRDEDYVNLAVLRIVPKEAGKNFKTVVPLPKYLSIIEFRNFVQVLFKCYEKIFNTLHEAEVEIKLVSK
jgi:hypothetical protein